MNKWVRIHDRVRDGEMPPVDYGPLDEEEIASFVNVLGDRIKHQESSQRRDHGRVVARRLTRKQVERSIQDLLGIDIPLADQLPEESSGHVFSTVSERQSISHFQLQSHLAVVDVALDEAFRRAMNPQDDYRRTFDAQGMARRNPKRRCREPEMREGQAVIWNGGVAFYGRIPATTAPS